MTASGNSTERLLLLGGTRDGLYIFEQRDPTSVWTRTGPHLAGLDVSHAQLDPRNGRTIFAAATGNGITAVYRSRDLGESWDMAGSPFEVDQVWHVEPGHPLQHGRVYAGAMPGALFASDDDGDSWRPLTGLSQHASREEWWEGGSGGINVHRILVDPRRPERIYAGISVAGLFRSDDGGETWSPKNEGVFRFSEWGDDIRHGDVHRCIHSAVLDPYDGRVIYQQNHVGVYRSGDGGDSWTEITAGLPSNFGFVIAITHQHPPAVFVVPQDADNIRMSGQFTVYRTRDGGASWDALTNGLPVVERLTLYREAMTADHHDPAGVYFGTSDGAIWASRDTGDTWSILADGLPPVRSVTTGVPNRR